MKFRSRYISAPSVFALGVLLLQVLFFQVWRLVLLFKLSDLTIDVPGLILFQSFFLGTRFDLAIAAYVAAPLYLMSTIPRFKITHNKVVQKICLGFLITVSAITFFIHLVDIEFFLFFNSRLNGSVLQWSDTPGFMFSMVWQTYPVVWYLVLYSVLLSLFIAAVHKLLRWVTAWDSRTTILVNLLWIPVTFVVLGVLARGRIEEKAPLTWGLAYFSEYDVANQLALNPTFTFLRDAVYDVGSKQNTASTMEAIAFPEVDSLVRVLTGRSYVAADSSTLRLHRRVEFYSENDNPPNVILIIMESFGASRIGVLDNRYSYDLTPHFDVWSRRGTLFTDFYSSGSHTYSGLFCTLYGYPLIFGKSVMKQVTGQNRFWGLPSILLEHDYETLFFTTHDPHFDNMQGFLISNGMQRIFSLEDYDSSEKLSTLGVPDHVMFDRAIEELGALGEERFFATLLTASNHGPWLVPDVPYGPLPEEEDDRLRLNAFKYSDWALGRFIAAIADNPRFSNTLIVVTSDNGMLYQPMGDMDLTQYHIPLLILHTDSLDESSGRQISSLASQIDILPTVMGRVRLEYDDYSFGRDLLDSSETGVEYAQFSDWLQVGYIQNDYYNISRLDGPQALYRIDPATGRIESPVNLVDSLPEMAIEYNRKALAIFQRAYYNMLLPMSENGADSPEHR
ncbi:MAG: sulfatase-like hydrolase/transferase [candidate division Zixibacteria bacterium]|nr:sulfatase-like hydrolase/transferase [candidate division Zixibacteria bacterium]